MGFKMAYFLVSLEKVKDRIDKLKTAKLKGLEVLSKKEVFKVIDDLDNEEMLKITQRLKEPKE